MQEMLYNLLVNFLKTKIGGSRRSHLLLGLILFILAFSLRFPYIDYPNKTPSDEQLYITFTLNTIYKLPFFEIHPPLSRMVFALIAAPSHPSLRNPLEVDESFGDFPYQHVRMFNAILGSFLPVIIFGIALSLGYSSAAGLIPAFFITINRMFIFYSRSMLPDMLLWTLGFSGIVLLLQSFKREGWQRYGFIFASTICFGLTASVKWTGFGFLLAALFYLIITKHTKYIIQTVLIAFSVYLLVWFSYFALFDGGKVALNRSYYPATYISELSFPKPGDIAGFVESFIQYHKIAFRVNRDPAIMQSMVRTGNPFEWPLGIGEKDSRLGAGADVPSSTLAFIAIICALVMMSVSVIRHRPLISKSEIFLLAGYFINYLPFFWITMSRPMYIYHYGVSLIFAFLLMPPMFYILGRFLDKEKGLPQWFIYVIVSIIIIFFVFQIPEAYGL